MDNGKRHLRLIEKFHDRNDSDDLSRFSRVDGTDHVPINHMGSDEKIIEGACYALRGHRELAATNIAVKVEYGVVYLTGTVPSRRMKKSPKSQEIKCSVLKMSGTNSW